MYEAYIFAEFQKTISNHDVMAAVSTWRTQDQAEVDLVLSTPKTIIPLEITWSNRLTKRDASGLLSFLEDHPNAKQGYIVYPGDTLQTITPHVMAIPDWWLFGCVGESPAKR